MVQWYRLTGDFEHHEQVQTPVFASDSEVQQIPFCTKGARVEYRQSFGPFITNRQLKPSESGRELRGVGRTINCDEKLQEH